jgi:plastocyanin
VFITYQDFEIVPAETTISVGTRVIFLIKGSLHQPYNFTAPNTFEAQANLGDGASYTFTFNDAGTVTLLCGYHPNMSATLIVAP